MLDKSSKQGQLHEGQKPDLLQDLTWMRSILSRVPGTLVLEPAEVLAGVQVIAGYCPVCKLVHR